VATGKRTRIFESTAERGPLSAAFSPQGDFLAIGYKDRAEAWYIGKEEAKKNPERIYRTEGLVTAIAYDAKTERIALGVRKTLKFRDDAEPEIFGDKSEVVVFNMKTGEEIKRFEGFEGQTGNRPTKLPVTAIAFSPDGTHLAAGTGIHFSATPNQLPQSGEMKVWKLEP
jgi:WD40 repeat protein